MPGFEPFVLVADDGADNADSMALLLTLWRYAAEPRYCGRSALVAASTRPPAAVLLDLGMAPMSGFEFAVRFRELPGCEETPIVAITGHTSQAFQTRAKSVGIAEYLFKPADPCTVRALLARLCPLLGTSRVAPEPAVERSGYVLFPPVSCTRSAVAPPSVRLFPTPVARDTDRVRCLPLVN